IFSYFTGRTVLNYYTVGNTQQNNNSYFGDILLLNNHPLGNVGNTTNNDRNVVAGVIAYAENAYILNNSFSANIQANGAIMGGVIGKVISGHIDEISGNWVDTNLAFVNLINVSVDGYLINRNSVPAGVEPVTANFFGSAE